MASELRIQLLGEPLFFYRGKEVYLGSKKGTALLCYLVLSSEGYATREEVKNLLWGSVSETRAQSNLRHTCWKISKVMETAGFSGFVSSRNDLRLSPKFFQTDLDDVLGSMNTPFPDPRLRAKKNVLEELLSPLKTITPEFSSWLYEKKLELRENCKSRLNNLITNQENGNENIALIAETSIRFDSLNETAHRIVMQERARLDDVAGALAVYQDLCEAMDVLQGMNPSETTQELAVAIKNGELNHQCQSIGQLNSPPPMRSTILIGSLTMAGISGPHQSILSGFRHELIACLTRFREWRVSESQISPTGGENPSIDISYLLEFSVFEISNRFRLVVTLKEYITDTFLWSEQFHATTVDWLESQAVIVRRLAMTLNVQLSSERLNLIKSSGTFPLVAYDRWLLAEQLFLSSTLESWEESRVYLEELTRDYPGFSRPYSTLAQMENSAHLHFPGLKCSACNKKKALEYALKAVEIDQMDSRNQLCLGWSHAMAGNFDRAEVAFNLAHKSNENDVWTLISSAAGLSFCGHSEKSVELSEQANLFIFAPSSTHHSFQAVIAFMNKDYGDCVRYSRLGGESTTDAWAWQAAALVKQGRGEAAKSVFNQYLEFTKTKWHGKRVPTSKNVVQWLSESFPFANSCDRLEFKNLLSSLI